MDVDEPEIEGEPQAQESEAQIQGDDELAARRAEAEAGIAALQQKKQPTKVSQKKVDQVKVSISSFFNGGRFHTYTTETALLYL